MYSIIVIGEYEFIYSENLRQMYLEKFGEVQKLIAHFKSVEDGATVTFMGREHLGLLLTEVEVDCAEDPLKSTINLILRRLVGAFVPVTI